MDILFVVGVVLLFYAALAFDGVSPGEAPVAVIVFGVLSYLGYAAGHAYFGW